MSGDVVTIGDATLYHGDCLEILPTLPKVDAVVTDPPYGIPAGAAVWRRNGTAIEDWGVEAHNAEVTGWRELVKASDAWIVEFGVRAGDSFAMARNHASAGWSPSNFYALVKSAPAPTPRPGFANAIELAVVSRAGRPKWHGTGYVPNRWIGLTPNRAGTDHGHPTEKPLEAMQQLVAALCATGFTTLDPFMGSGTTGVACANLGRKFIGIEIERKYFDIACERIDAAYSQGRLFA
jgi:site-specific DNA-methyltransferase (adenine-specific)